MARQKLVTAELAKKIPALYATEKLSDKEKMVVAKFFNPCGAGTWYIIEYDGDDTFFGYADLGDPDCAELGYISKSELESLRLPFGMYIERDIAWTPKPLADVIASVKGH